MINEIKLLVFGKSVTISPKGNTLDNIDNDTLMFALNNLVTSTFKLEKYKYNPNDSWNNIVRFFSYMDFDPTDSVRILTYLPKEEEIIPDLLPGIMI